MLKRNAAMIVVIQAVPELSLKRNSSILASDSVPELTLEKNSLLASATVSVGFGDRLDNISGELYGDWHLSRIDVDAGRGKILLLAQEV